MNERILIYGTGVIAERIIKSVSGENDIVGVLDRYKQEGYVGGVPIVTWDDLKKGDADCMMIAATERNCREIFHRVFYKCHALGLRVYDRYGEAILGKYEMENRFDMEAASYYYKNKEELRRRIDEHDCISFDLFDTLIMRRTLEPRDVFDILDERLKKQDIIIPDFKKKRIIAEIQSKGADINRIYEILEEMLGLDHEVCEYIMHQEICCEKECLIPRISMAELFNYAVAKGKRVNIISDMYLTSVVLKEILAEMDITGYERIYVSCEYGKWKGNGLFEEYLSDVRSSSCLHIGDNHEADIIPAKKCGIDTYEVKSAYDMLRISSILDCLKYESGKYDKLLIGFVLAELFNDPFALYGTSGIVCIKEMESVVKVFVVPMVILYMQELMKVLREKNYRGILFGARDGLLLKKIYDSEVMGKIDENTQSIYFITSRILALKASYFEPDDLQMIFDKWDREDAERVVKTMFDMEPQDVPYNIENIMQQCAAFREFYLGYMKNAGIDLEASYLFCDLISGGTTHKALNRLFQAKLDGFYFCRDFEGLDGSICVRSPYGKESYHVEDKYVNLLEKIITASEASIYGMTEGGQPVYGDEIRTQEEITVVMKLQEEILQYIGRYMKLCPGDIDINKELANCFLRLSSSVRFEDDAAMVHEMRLEDNIKGIILKVL